MLSIAPKGPIAGGGQAQGAAGQQTENRSAPRRLAAALPSITGLRISPHGVEARLVNISESGVLAECGERLKPGSSVTVVFEGTFTPRTMEGRVARNSVSSMGSDGRLRYHVGIAFAKRIALPAEEPSSVEPPAAPAPVAATPPEAAAPTAASTPAAPTAAASTATSAAAAASTTAAPIAPPPSAPRPVPAPAIAAVPTPAPAAAEEPAPTIPFPQPVRNRW